MSHLWITYVANKENGESPIVLAFGDTHILYHTGDLGVTFKTAKDF